MTRWTAILVFVSLTTGTSFTTIDRCEYLKNGKYKVKFDSEFPAYSDYELQIYGNTYSKLTKEGEKIKGTLERISDCLFSMDDIIPEPDSQTELGKTLKSSFGKSCIEVKSVHGDSIYFRTTYTGNLHITTNEGVLVRMKDNTTK